MTITKREVRTITHIEFTTADLNEVIQHYLRSEGNKICYPKAFDGIAINNDMTESELQTAIKKVWRSHGDTYTVIAQHLGFDGWDNGGYYKEKTNTYTMTVYNYGDQLN